MPEGRSAIVISGWSSVQVTFKKNVIFFNMDLIVVDCSAIETWAANSVRAEEITFHLIVVIEAP